LLLVGAAVLFGLMALRFASLHRERTVAPLEMKITTAVSLTFVLGAAVAGRVIGVL
jgi:hypothetical protein